MVMLPQTYNCADLPDTGGVVKIPDGQYKAVIIDSELKTTSNGNGQFLALKIVITEGPHQDTEFTERLNIINQNSKAVEIAFKTLARISEALGMTQTPQDSSVLHNKPLIIVVGTEAGKDYKDNDGVMRTGQDKSVIKKYLPIPSVGFAGKPAFGVSPATQSAVQSAVMAGQTAVNQHAAQSAPWKK